MCYTFLLRKSVYEPMYLAGSEVSVVKSLLKKDSNPSIENGSFKGFALLLAFHSLKQAY